MRKRRVDYQVREVPVPTGTLLKLLPCATIFGQLNRGKQ